MEVFGTIKRKEVVIPPIPIHQSTQGLGEFDIICSLEYRRSWRVDVCKLLIVKVELYSDKLDGFATLIQSAILDRQENHRVGGHPRVFDLTTSLVMEAQYLKQLKGEPAVLKELEPFFDHALDRSAEVQMNPKLVEHDAEVEGLRGKSCLINLEGVGTLVNHHRVVDNGV
jgi:hypothetical protein